MNKIVLFYRLPSNITQTHFLFIFKTPTLISNIGGSLGLFTGMAIIMIFELLELSWDVVYNIWNHLNGSNRKLAECQKRHH